MTSREAFEAHIQAKTGERPQMIGGFDTNLRWREDWEIWQAAYEAGRTAERAECAAIAGAYAENVEQVEQAHYRLSNRPFLMEHFGFDRFMRGMSKNIRDAIRARGKP